MQTPERIYHWLDSQLSIARFYGGISYQGNQYLIAYDEKDMPLVRQDVLKREEKVRKTAAKAEKARNDKLQERLIDTTHPDHASAPALRQLRRAQSTPAGWRIAVWALINAPNSPAAKQSGATNG